MNIFKFNIIFLFYILRKSETVSINEVIDGFNNLIANSIKQMFEEPEDVHQTASSYDFIIVGAGTAGCALANRLTANPEWHVLLIEAGGNEEFFVDIPGLASLLQQTKLNWNYTTEPSPNGKYCASYINGRCIWPRGKVMGGSSSINTMFYTRGNRRDYDEWAEMGNDGWSFKEVLPYFKKIEDFVVPEPFDEWYHGKNGYIKVDYLNTESKFAKLFINASIDYGFDYVDFNGPEQIGVSRLQTNIYKGVRESSNKGYLFPIRNRKNLHVKKNAMVKKILIDSKNKQAYGVEYVNKFGNVVKVLSRKEVIVSGGAINSPQLLMLSGIGPKKHLESLKIPVISDLSVGENLMDHIAPYTLPFIMNKSYELLPAMSSDQIIDYLVYGNGTLATALEEVVIYSNLNDFNNKTTTPTTELFIFGSSTVQSKSGVKRFGISGDLYEKLYQPIQNKHVFMILPFILKPKSRGRILLRDNNYKSKPLIYPNYFDNDEDMDIAIKGIKLAINITHQPVLKEIGVHLYDLKVPKCVNFTFGSDDYFKCVAKQLTFTIYHPCGTCKMGPKSDKTAVVDNKLKVYGVKNLRVIDASIMPVIPAGHTNAPTWMIAEKGADLIKEDWDDW